MCSFRLFCIAAGLMCTASAAAQTDSAVSGQPNEQLRPGNAGLWMVGLLAQADDESSRGSALSFGYGVGEATWLSGLLTRSRSPSQRADISADALVLGVDHRFERLGLSFEYEDWGESGAVESRDFGASMYFHNERFEAELSLEQRDIDITFGLPLGDLVFTRKVPVDADGVALALRLRAGDRARIYLSWRDYDYSRDLTILPRIQQFSRLNGSALTLANSFIADERALGVDVTFGEKLLSLTFSEDSSAVDASELTSFGAALVIPAAARIDVEISLGRSDSDVLRSSTYGGVGILIYGG